MSHLPIGQGSSSGITLGEEDLSDGAGQLHVQAVFMVHNKRDWKADWGVEATRKTDWGVEATRQTYWGNELPGRQAQKYEIWNPSHVLQ